MALNIDNVLASVGHAPEPAPPVPTTAPAEPPVPSAAPADDTEDTEPSERIRGRFRTIVTKFPGKCLRCMGPVSPGETVRWLAPPRDARGRKRGRGRTYHLAARCPANTGTEDYTEEAEDYEEQYG